MTTTLDLDDLVQQGDNPVAVEELKQMRQGLELLKGKKEMLLRAARELKSYIDDANQKLKEEVHPQSMEPPDYHDYQTVYELEQLVGELNEQ